jgi:hypothetical protein
MYLICALTSFQQLEEKTGTIPLPFQVPVSAVPVPAVRSAAVSSVVLSVLKVLVLLPVCDYIGLSSS